MFERVEHYFFLALMLGALVFFVVAGYKALTMKEDD
jgi:hypothetical protein